MLKTSIIFEYIVLLHLLRILIVVLFGSSWALDELAAGAPESLTRSSSTSQAAKLNQRRINLERASIHWQDLDDDKSRSINNDPENAPGLSLIIIIIREGLLDSLILLYVINSLSLPST